MNSFCMILASLRIEGERSLDSDSKADVDELKDCLEEEEEEEEDEDEEDDEEEVGDNSLIFLPLPPPRG